MIAVRPCDRSAHYGLLPRVAGPFQRVADRIQVIAECLDRHTGSDRDRAARAVDRSDGVQLLQADQFRRRVETVVVRMTRSHDTDRLAHLAGATDESHDLMLRSGRANGRSKAGECLRVIPNDVSGCDASCAVRQVADHFVPNAHLQLRIGTTRRWIHHLSPIPI